MAQDFNQFSFIGRLVTDLDITPSSGSREGYGRARMVTSGYTEEKTLWLTVFFPERVIGRIHEYMTKGKPLAVTGRLSQDNYKDKDGNDRQGLTLNATSVDFIPSGRQQEGDETSQVAPSGTQTGRMSASGANKSQRPRSNNDDVDVDELPF